MANRVYLGGVASISGRTRVYLNDSAIEVDEHLGFLEGQRRRVLLDEVQLVTHDRRRTFASILISGGLALFLFLCVFAGAFAASKSLLVPFLGALGVSAPFWLFSLLSLTLGNDVVRVVGRRSTAQVQFQFRKARARAVFERIVDAATRAQNSGRVEQTRPAAPELQIASG